MNLNTALKICLTDLRSPVITGNTTAVEGDALNLTCSVESFPAPVILWTKFDPNVTLPSRTDTGSATLFIPEVTKEQSGRYICTVKHLNTNFSVYADVTVTCKYTTKLYSYMLIRWRSLFTFGTVCILL